MDEFKQRHALTRVNLWRQTADIWAREQQPYETVQNCQDGSIIVDWCHIRLRVLKPAIRLHILHTDIKIVDGVLLYARIAEAALPANANHSAHSIVL